MLASDGQGGLRLPFVRVVEAARQCVRGDQGGQLRAPSPFDGEDPDDAFTFQDAKDDDFAGFSPAALTRMITARHRLIALNDAFKRLRAFFTKAVALGASLDKIFQSSADLPGRESAGVRGLPGCSRRWSDRLNS